MSTPIRKKSPRSPSMTLGDAIERTGRIYDKQRLHAGPAEVVAQHLGYSGGETNGAARQALASLRYYGLIERDKGGGVLVSPTYEQYRFMPEPAAKRAQVTQWLRTPPVFTELLDSYPGGLPADANIKYALITKGFLPTAAAECATIFRKSVEFAGYFDEVWAPLTQPGPDADDFADEQSLVESTMGRHALSVPPPIASETFDRIPVRLPGGRRAWLEIPVPFYESDKARLTGQIALLLTEVEPNDSKTGGG